MFFALLLFKVLLAAEFQPKVGSDFVVSDPAFDDRLLPWDLSLYDGIADLTSTIGMEMQAVGDRISGRYHHAISYTHLLQAMNVEFLTKQGGREFTASLMTVTQLVFQRKLFDLFMAMSQAWTANDLNFPFISTLEQAMDLVYGEVGEDIGDDVVFTKSFLDFPARFSEPAEWDRLMYAFLGRLRGSRPGLHLLDGTCYAKKGNNVSLQTVVVSPQKLPLLQFALNCKKIMAGLVRLRYLFRLHFENPVSVHPVSLKAVCTAISDWCFAHCLADGKQHVDFSYVAALIHQKRYVSAFESFLKAKIAYDLVPLYTWAVGNNCEGLIATSPPELHEYIRKAKISHGEISEAAEASLNLAANAHAEELLKEEAKNSKKPNPKKSKGKKNKKQQRQQKKKKEKKIENEDKAPKMISEPQPATATVKFGGYVKPSGPECDSDGEEDVPLAPAVSQDSIPFELAQMHLSEWQPSIAWQAMAKVYLAQHCRRSILIPLRDKLYTAVPANFSWKQLLTHPNLKRELTLPMEDLEFCIQITVQRNKMLKGTEILAFLPSDANEIAKYLKHPFDGKILSFLLSLNFVPSVIWDPPKYTDAFIPEEVAKSQLSILALHRLCSLTPIGYEGSGNAEGEAFCRQIMKMRNPIAHPSFSFSFITSLMAEYRRHFQ